MRCTTKIVPGERFGRWTVLQRAERTSYFAARCDCGTEKDVHRTGLISGASQSCGCHRREILAGLRMVHGGRRSPEYKAWAHIKQRCLNPSNIGYADYGGRGITICPEWADDFSAFARDMGERPSPKHSIDRIDFNGNYEPGNCRWATDKQQVENRRCTRWVKLDGEEMVLADAVRRLGIHATAIHYRIRAKGVTHQAAVDHFAARRTMGDAQ